MASLGKRLQYFNLFYNNQLKPAYYLQMLFNTKNNALRINKYNTKLLFYVYSHLCKFVKLFDFCEKINFVSFGKKSYYSKYVGFIQFMFVGLSKLFSIDCKVECVVPMMFHKRTSGQLTIGKTHPSLSSTSARQFDSVQIVNALQEN